MGNDRDDELMKLMNADLDSLLIDIDDDDDNDVPDEDLETESFSERMKRYGTDITHLRAEYRNFKIWYEGMLKLIKAQNQSKTIVCRALMGYIFNDSRDDDAAKLWCICMSEYSDFVFENPMDNDEEYILYNYMPLMEDIKKMTAQLRSEYDYKQKFHDIVNNISITDEIQCNFDFTEIIGAFCEGDTGTDIIRDNLMNLCDRIKHSPELSQIIPLVLYAVMTRYQRKMFESEGFEPNFKKALQYNEFIIDRDNGKNISNFYEHLELYRVLRQYTDCDKMLCDIGFAELSNIVKCEMLMWEDYPMIKRPIRVEAESRYFSCFPNGYLDNPYFSENEIDLNYIDSYEALDQSLPGKRKILKKAEDYITEHDEISERYIKMIENNTTDKCVSLINEIINNSGIDVSAIKPNHVDIAYCCIMQLVMNDIDRRVKGDMIQFADIIMKWYRNN